MMSAKDCLKTGCKKCEFCIPGVTVSEFKPGCAIFPEGLNNIGDLPPFPVMHGSRYYEPQTIGECTNTSCYECAYKFFKIDPSFVATIGIKGNCQHREIMIQVELVIV